MIQTCIQDIDRPMWQALAESARTSTWFQTPEAYDFYAAQPELFAPFVVAIPQRAYCVGYVTQEKRLWKQWLTRRAIIIGGPLLADDCTQEEVMTLLQTLRQTLNGRCIYLETRNFNDYSPWKDAFRQCGFTYQPHLNFHVDTSSAEVVETNLGKSRKRDIKTSFRDGATVVDSPSLEQVREYYTILQKLYTTKVKTPLFPLSFFEQLWKNKDGRFILVMLNGEVIGGTVCVAQPNRCLFEWFVAGRDGEWKSIFPSSVATYSGICYAAEHGMPRFDMMGAGTPDEAYGVRSFKAHFGGKEVEHGRFVHVCKPLLYQIGKLGVKILKKL